MSSEEDDIAWRECICCLCANEAFVKGGEHWGTDWLCIRSTGKSGERELEMGAKSERVDEKWRRRGVSELRRNVTPGFSLAFDRWACELVGLGGSLRGLNLYLGG